MTYAIPMTLDEYIDDVLKRCDIEPGKGVTCSAEQLSRAIREMRKERDQWQSTAEAFAETITAKNKEIDRLRALLSVAMDHWRIRYGGTDYPMTDAEREDWSRCTDALSPGVDKGEDREGR